MWAELLYDVARHIAVEVTKFVTELLRSKTDELTHRTSAPAPTQLVEREQPGGGA
jgi:hypothetical protein